MRRLIRRAIVLAVVAVACAGAIRVGCGTPPGLSQVQGVPRLGEPALVDLVPATERRREDNAYLTFPEWYIVYSAQDYAEWTARRTPTEFPYFHSVGQYWCGYSYAYQLTADRYEPNYGYHAMLLVIGVSYTLEYAAKGLYEGVVGRLTEAVSTDPLTQEDRFAAAVAREYAEFLPQRPWYLFPFWARVQLLWSGPLPDGPDAARRWERRVALSVEYVIKAAYGWVIGQVSGAAYGADQERSLAVVQGYTDEALRSMSDIRVVRRLADDRVLVSVPRYAAFDRAVRGLSEEYGQLLMLGGNDQIVLSVVAPAGWAPPPGRATRLFDLPLPLDPGWRRIALLVPVPGLLDLIRGLGDGARLEHVYDY
ncbi:MAG: hypothetical protein U0821_03775 [Chloroflexota bacterium]